MFGWYKDCLKTPLARRNYKNSYEPHYNPEKRGQYFNVLREFGFLFNGILFSVVADVF